MAIGAMAGLGSALGLFLVLGVVGLVDDPQQSALLVIVQFGALVVAGYVAGALAPMSAVLHGGWAGIAVFLVSAALTLAVAGDAPGLGALMLLGVIAAVLGSAGGALADRRRGDPAE